ncbi:MAG: glycosyltransferase family 2 protein [Gammaproteobacteria bacterium]|nr:glycosyltransferase family 2 protein [Gammaproteobacteria bacterium]
MTDNGANGSTPLVSVIVPVFNVASYIEQGVQSLADQDFARAYEVILIDDASTDASLEACRGFAANYPERFILLESEHNAGVSAARNRGLDHARGKYLMFFDPDDVLPQAALSDLYNTAEQYHADIVKGNLTLFDETTHRPAPDQVHRTARVFNEDVLTALFEHSAVRGHVGGKMFRADKFGTIRFIAGVRMAQDLLYFSQMFAAAESMLLLDREVYRYRKHQTGSTGSKYEKGSYTDWLGAVEKSGEFASTARQKRAHKSLMLRTMTQMARECQKIPAASAAPVLQVIDEKCRQWNIRLSHLILRDRLGLRSISRYIKLQLALKQIRHNLSQS